MEFQIVPPPDSLKDHIRYFWVWENPEHSAAQVFRPVADGCPGLIFQPSEQETFRDPGGKHYPFLFLYGQTVRHRELHAQGLFRTWGICFRPHALKGLFGIDADALTDACTPFGALFPQKGFSLPQELLDLPTARQQMERMATFLQQRLEQNKYPGHGSTRHALARLLHAQGNVPLKTLQESLNLSERGLERKFRSDVGISPKLFSRICRFQAALQQLKKGHFDKLSDIAFENGYADQSHFIRVFREFSGFTPDEYRKHISAVDNLSHWKR